jgi:CBS domain containing-hemolysin-like protein
LFQALEKHPHRIIITILIVSSLAHATAAALITHIMETLFARFHLSEGLGFSIGIFIASSSILIFGEIIPKQIARSHGEGPLRSLLWITNGVYFLLYPFVQFLTKISDFITQKLGKKVQEDEPSEKEIQFLIDYIDEKGLMDPDKTEMLQNIFRLGKKPVKEIMVPEIDVISVDANLKIKDALLIFTKYQFSRLPVYENDPDNIIGIIYQKDVFNELIQKPEQKSVKDIVRPIMYVPESLKVNQLLRQFKLQQMHMAMVLNEYGGMSGLVTLEDVLEEIVGEIADEYESISKKVISLKENEWLVDASISLEDLTELLNITFEAEDVFTLGGFLTEQLQHLPKKGDRISYKNYCFQIQKASPKRVLQVLVFKDNQ